MKGRIFNVLQYEFKPITNENLHFSENNIILGLNHKSIKDWAYIMHDKDVYTEEDVIRIKEFYGVDIVVGSLKNKHWHIVLRFDGAVDTSVIAKWFGVPENFIHVPKGKNSFVDCVDYLTHSDQKQQALGKYLYPDENVKSNFDWKTAVKKYRDNKIKFGRDVDEKTMMRYAVLYDGKNLATCRAENPLLYMEDYKELKRLRLEYLSNQKPPDFRLNYYITGGAGEGKGLMSRSIARNMYPDLQYDEDIFFETGSDGATFENYDGQPVIIWNDCRSFELLKILGGRGNVFTVFDTKPTAQRQNIKYSSLILCNAVNIVNSVQPYEDFLNGLAGEYTDKHGNEYKSEDKNQSYRRFPAIINLRYSDFDIMVNKGFVGNGKSFEI